MKGNEREERKKPCSERLTIKIGASSDQCSKHLSGFKKGTKHCGDKTKLKLCGFCKESKAKLDVILDKNFSLRSCFKWLNGMVICILLTFLTV